QRFSVILLRAGRPARAACHGGVCLARPPDGARISQRVLPPHFLPAGVFQPVFSRARPYLCLDIFGRLSDRSKPMSHVDNEFDESDVGPGFMEAVDRSVREGIQAYATGFVFAALLTAASFAVMYTDLIWDPAIPAALVALAVAQMGI